MEEESPLPGGEDAVLFSSRIDFGGEMVGLSSEYNKLKQQLASSGVLALRVVSLVGMAGIGKTILADKIFEDESILSHFDCRVRVTLGRKCQLKEIQRSILAQVNLDTNKMLGDEEEKIAQHLYESLNGKKYFILLDDIWDTQVWDDLESLFRDEKNGSRVLLTTRLHKVAQHASKSMDVVMELSLLNKEESWDLLCKKVFAKKSCPPQLEKAGKKIAENCEGLPLTIVTVASLLFKAERNQEYWNKVATERQNPLFKEAYDKISKVIYPSYEYLPLHLKEFFLYMGVFPQNYEVPRSKLINMWIAEGFLESYKLQIPAEDYIVRCLNELKSNSLVMLSMRSTIRYLISTAGIKTCRLHSSLWNLCNREARKIKFFHVLDSHKDGKEEDIKGQGRLSIHNNILFGIKNVHKSIEDNGAPTAYSLLCFGPDHRFEVPICFSLKLLKILDALTIRFYEFPERVRELIHLRYLALTCNRELHAAISKLCNLQFLIVRQHLSIKSGHNPSYLPTGIWDMKELKHLQVTGSDLQDLDGTLLPNLLTLLDVTAHSCTKGVFKRIPNLEKLGIRIELSPNDDGKSMSCFEHISLLKRLRSLKCVIVNPRVGPPHAPLSSFPSYLKKLSLSGLGNSWEEMSRISSLPNLEVLKLRCYAFRGPVWETKENGFSRLKILLIEDTDLVQWKAGHGSFPLLTCLSLKCCHKLEELCLEFGIFLSKIELVDCNPLAVTCVEQIKEAELRKGYNVPYVHVHSSWDDGNAAA